MEYKVKIDAFEGPLDLLLHLIKHLEIDIYDIPVAEITEQYLDFIHHMRVLQLDVASEYMVMAATLIAMKSRMLLPKQNPLEGGAEDESLEMEEDPREALMRQLIEYRQYKQAAMELKVRGEKRNQLFSKPPSDLSDYSPTSQTALPAEGKATVADMIDAFRRLMKQNRIQAPLRAKIERQSLPIGQRMSEVMAALKKADGRPLMFESLFPYPNRTHVIVTFLALLELMKKGRIICMQESNFADITICPEKGADQLDERTDDIGY